MARICMLPWCLAKLISILYNVLCIEHSQIWNWSLKEPFLKI